MILLNTPVILGLDLDVYFILFIIAIPVFFIWRWLFRKVIIVTNYRLMATWVATLAATPLIYAGLVLLLLFSMSYYPNHSFNREKWINDREDRYQFSQKMISSKMLIGKTKTEVRQMLGDVENSDSTNSWYYYLGIRPEFSNIDPDNMEIIFQDGKVTDVIQHKR